MDKNNVKNQQLLGQKLSEKLKLFEKITQWPDFVTWMTTVEELLNSFKGCQMPNVEKIMLSKRLAQCLNPNLPQGLHQNTLKVYTIIFENILSQSDKIQQYQPQSTENFYIKQVSSDLALYSIGLFPCFQYASYQIKPDLLKIIQTYYFKLGAEIIPCIPGMIISILPGLEETNEELQKKVLYTLEGACKCAGEKYFFGSLWMAILRVPRVRNAAYKYLMSKLKSKAKNSETYNSMDEINSSNFSILNQKQSFLPLQLEQKLSSNQLENNNSNEQNQNPSQLNQNLNSHITSLDFFGSEPILKIQRQYLKDIESIKNLEQEDTIYPNKKGLVINALIASLEDDNQLVRRSVLDFLNTHLPLSDPMFDENEKVLLIQGCLYLYILKEYATTRRIDTWLLGVPDDENKYQITEENQFVIEILVQALKRIFSDQDENKINMLMLMDESDRHSSELQKQSLQQQQITHSGQEQASYATIPIKILQNFYQKHEHLVESTIQPLSYCILKYIYQYYELDDVQKSANRLLESIASHTGLILHSLSNQLIKSLNDKEQALCLEIINLITFLLDTLLIDFQKFHSAIQSQNIIPIIQRIIDALCQLDAKNVFKWSFMEGLIKLILNLIDKFTQINYQNQQTIIKDEKQISKEDSDLSNSSDNLNEQYSQDQQPLYDDPMKPIIKFCQLFTQMANYLVESDKNNEIINMKIIEDASNILIKLQKYAATVLNYTYDPNKPAPDWLQSLFQMLHLQNQNSQIIAIDSCIEILKFTNNGDNKFQEAKNLLNSFIVMQDDMVYVRLIFQNLWKMLDYHNQKQQKIISYMLVIEQLFPKIFRQVIEESFQTSDITQLEYSIRRYAIFYKMTNLHYKKKSELNCGVGLKYILTFLEHPNPLIKNSSRGWLSQSAVTLFRTMDPLLEELLSIQMNAQIYFFDSRHYIYQYPYDAANVIKGLQMLKSIVWTLKDIFLEYLYNTKLSSKAKISVAKSPFNNRIDKDEVNYLEIVIAVCIRFIQGKALESLSISFYQDNFTAVAYCCDLIESLLQSLLQSEKVHIILTILTQTLSPILINLYKLIENNDFAMQVQMLNLIKVMIMKYKEANLSIKKNNNIDKALLLTKSFSCESQKNEEGEDADNRLKKITKTRPQDLQTQLITLEQTITSSMYFKNLMEGLVKAKIQYVKAMYIDLLTVSFVVLSDIISEKCINENIKSVITDYLNMIYQKQLQFQEEDEDYDEQEQQSGEAINNQGEFDKSLEVNKDKKNGEKKLASIQEKKKKMRNSNIRSDGNQQRNSGNNNEGQEAGDNGLIQRMSLLQSPQRYSKVFKFTQDASINFSNIQQPNPQQLLQTFSSSDSQQNYQEVLTICEATKEMYIYFLKLNEETYQTQQPLQTEEQTNLFIDIITLRLLRPSYYERQRRDSKVNKTNSPQKVINNIGQTLLNELPQLIEKYLHCWNLSMNFKEQINFCDKGIRQYNNEDFKEYFIIQQEQIKKYKQQQSSSLDKLKLQILSLLNKLKNKFSTETINAVLIIWMQQCQELFYSQSEKNEVMFKLIELLVFIEIKPEEILAALQNCHEVTQIQNFYKIFQNQLQKQYQDLKIIQIEQQIAVMESKILFFLYTYFSYQYIEVKDKDHLHAIWSVVMRFLDIFKNSKIPSTVQWIIEIMFLLSRKINPKSIYNDKGLKKQIHQTIKSCIKELANLGAMYSTFIQFSYLSQAQNQDQQQQSIKLIQSQKEKKVSGKMINMVVPFPPTLFHMYESYTSFIQGGKVNLKGLKEKWHIEEQIFDQGVENQDYLEATNFQNRQSLIALKVLNSVSFELLQNTVELPEKVVSYVKKFMEIIFPVIQAEVASELLLNILKGHKRELNLELRKEIFEIFKMKDFFQCQKLNYWSQIINVYTSHQDIIGELLIKESLFSGVFNKQILEDQKIRKFQRICFMIYSGEEDQYAGKLDQLMENISEIIKEPEQTQPTLLILILFCIRILILRLSKKTLGNLLRNIWPMLITFLMQIFDKKNNKMSKNSNLIIGGIKLIELISIVQIDEFYLHQWVFVFDCKFNYEIVEIITLNIQKDFGISIEEIPTEDNKNQQDDDIFNKINTKEKQIISPFYFKPYLSGFVPMTFRTNYQNHQAGDNEIKNYKKEKRKLVIKSEQSMCDEAELATKVRNFLAFMIKINEIRMEVDKKDLENDIEMDFIQLDKIIAKSGMQ